METLKSRAFTNQLHIALYGESIDEFKARLEKESNEKRVVDKTLSTQKMLQSGKLSVSEIANILNVSEDFVQEIQAKI